VLRLQLVAELPFLPLVHGAAAQLVDRARPGEHLRRSLGEHLTAIENVIGSPFRASWIATCIIAYMRAS
jgi:hypothetical protein